MKEVLLRKVELPEEGRDSARDLPMAPSADSFLRARFESARALARLRMVSYTCARVTDIEPATFVTSLRQKLGSCRMGVRWGRSIWVF